MLARANAHGLVEGSVPGMASLCRMSIAEFEAAIEPLLNPDPYSRNPDAEGRRIENSPGGWRIINYKNYRDKPQDQEGSAAERMRKYRKKKGERKDVTEGNVTSRVTSHYTEAEADKDLKGSPMAQPSPMHCEPQPSNPDQDALSKEKQEKIEAYKRKFAALEQKLRPKYPRLNIIGFLAKNTHNNHDACYLALQRLADSEQIIQSPEIYLEKIVSIESGNFNEREYIQNARKNIIGPEDAKSILSRLFTGGEEK